MKSFIYLDRFKMYSLSSQLMEGVTDYILEETRGSVTDDISQKGPVASGRIIAEIIEKTKAPGFHENSALDLLMKIIRTGTGLHGCRFGRPQSGSGHRRNSRYRRHSR